MDVSAIPRLNQTTGGTPDTIVVDILNPGSRAQVHPTSTFAFNRQQSFQTFFVNNVVPGTHLVRIEIYDSTGALFFAGEQQAVLNPGVPTAVRFVITPDDTTDPDAPPSPTFRCVQNADDEQGQPDVDVTADGYFFVVARVTDATVDQPNQSFDTYGFIHGERFQTNFDGSLPISIDANNGNGGDFDISQFATLEFYDGPTFFNQQAVHPRISINDSQAGVIAWLDTNPSPSAGGLSVMNTGRDPVVRSVILGPASNTTPNSDNFVEAEFTTPANAEPNIAGPSLSGLTRPSVSMTNLLGGDATIDYAFFDPLAEAPRFNDGGASSAVAANGNPPLPSGSSPVTANFNNAVNLTVTNRKTDDTTVIVAGGGADAQDQVVAQLTSPSITTPTTLVVNQGQPSEANGDVVTHVESDWFEGGTVVFVYTVLDTGTNGAGLYARCFDASLTTPIGDEIEIAPATANVFHDFGDVSVVESDGTFLVTWTEFSGSGNTRVLLQRFSCSDGSRTPSVPIDVAAGQGPLAITNQNSLSRVAATADGHAVVAWQTGVAELNVVNVKALARIFPESSTD